MNHGFFRVMTKTVAVTPADTQCNKTAILAAIDEACERKAGLLVLPELCVTGCSCGDLFLHRTLLDRAMEAALEIAAYTENKDLVVCYGLPLQQNGRLYAVTAVAANGSILGFVPKTSLSCYGEHADGRVFAPASEDVCTVRAGGVEVPFGTGLLFRCEEQPLFTLAVEMGDEPAGACPGSGFAALGGATVAVCPAASLEIIGRAERRRQLILSQSLRCRCAYAYVSAGDGETTGSGVFSGHNLIAEEGILLAEAAPFGCGTALADVDLEAIDNHRRKEAGAGDWSDGFEVIDFSLNLPEGGQVERPISRTPFVSEDEQKAREACRTAMAIQAQGLAARLAKTGIAKIVLGVSGGLDSTMALLAAVRCFDRMGSDRKNIIAITMPCFGTSDRTKSNAEKMSELLGVDLRLIDISDSVAKHLSDIGHDGTTPDVTFENAQARERTQVLMDVANLENGLVLGTGDLSEEALGWCTYNGDHMSMYNVNCDMPKTFIRSCVYYYADECGDAALKAVLRDVVDTPVSPELKPAVNGEIAQKTEDILGPYEAHDFFLYHFVRNGSGPEKILRLAKQAFAGIYADEDLEAWLRKFLWKFFSSQFKRNCAPDGPKVGSVDLAGGWRMPGDLSAASFVKELDR